MNFYTHRPPKDDNLKTLPSSVACSKIKKYHSTIKIRFLTLRSSVSSREILK